MGIWGNFSGKMWEFGEIGSNNTHYGIPCAMTRRLRYYMPKLTLGHLGAILGDLGSSRGKIGEIGGKLFQMTLTTAFLSSRRIA